MSLNSYFVSENKQFHFTRQQASNFAKGVAGDFNPIHDEDNKRFCVPGDLLFAVLLQEEGISQKMAFTFSGMVNDGIDLHVEHNCSQQSAVVDDKGKVYLSMSRSGSNCHDAALVEHVIREYVAFSGMNFPHIMVPLMKEQQMMFNTQRPLVIYESMKLEFYRFDITAPSVGFAGASFDVTGKRGLVTLNFEFTANGEVIGKGSKRMIASGLVPWDEDKMSAYVEKFNLAKAAFNERY